MYSQNTFPISGNVGIGTTSPSTSLEISESSEGAPTINLIGSSSCLTQFTTNCESELGKLEFTRAAGRTTPNIKAVIRSMQDDQDPFVAELNFQVGYGEEGKRSYQSVNAIVSYCLTLLFKIVITSFNLKFFACNKIK